MMDNKLKRSVSLARFARGFIGFGVFFVCIAIYLHFFLTPKVASTLQEAQRQLAESGDTTIFTLDPDTIKTNLDKLEKDISPDWSDTDKAELLATINQTRKELEGLSDTNIIEIEKQFGMKMTFENMVNFSIDNLRKAEAYSAIYGIIFLILGIGVIRLWKWVPWTIIFCAAIQIIYSIYYLVTSFTLVDALTVFSMTAIYGWIIWYFLQPSIVSQFNRNPDKSSAGGTYGV